MIGLLSDIYALVYNAQAEQPLCEPVIAASTVSGTSKTVTERHHRTI